MCVNSVSLAMIIASNVSSCSIKGYITLGMQGNRFKWPILKLMKAWARYHF